MSNQTLEQPQQIAENKVNVNGIAIRSGVSRNGIRYKEEELVKFAPTLTNRPILKDHNGTVDNAVGLVTKSESANGAIVAYQGWVKEDGTGLLEKIKDGRVKEVSIGAIAGRLVQESDDSDIMIAQDLVGMELSLTPVPGIVGTSISSRMERLIGKKPIFENVDLFSQAEENECPECGKKFGSKDELKKHMESHEEKEKSKNRLTEEDYNDIVKRLKDDGVLKKEFNLSFKEWEHEVNNKMEDAKALQEQLKSKDDEMKSLKTQLAAYESAKREIAVSEYKKTAAEKGVAERDTSKLSVETIALLTEQLNSIKSDLTKGRIGVQIQNVAPLNVTEATYFGPAGGKSPALLFEDGLFIEHPLDGSGKFAITCDPAKLKPEGYRWRLFKNQSPIYGGA